MQQLRRIALECLLTETIKWRTPCYMHQASNVLLIGGFKDYCALNFFKGALLNNDHQLLIQQTEQVQGGRQLRFTSVNEILAQETAIKAIIFEAIAIEKEGLKVPMRHPADFEMVEELQTKLNENLALKTAFYALTPGRQRGFNMFFSAAKQPKTRTQRITDAMPRIFDGKGIHDCVCGLSKKMPQCDGSHKYLKQDV